MTVVESNERGFTEKFILRALVISLLIHFLLFFLYRIGESKGWWANWAMPRWMQIVSGALAPKVPKKLAAIPPRVVPLMFVEVDPANAVPTPPKAAKFEGAQNTVAANRQIVKPSDVPNIDGRQTKALKTTVDAKPKAQPVQPTPPPQPAVTASVPKKAYTPGDLAFARPEDKTQHDNQTDAAAAADAQPQPVYQRPRTLAEARERNGTAGEQSRQAGGVNNVNLTGSSLDVKSTALGSYEGQMVGAIRTKWFQLLDKVMPNVFGKVVVSFKLHPDGRISDMKMTRNEVTDELGIFCEEAIMEPSPFGPWPKQMRLDIPSDTLDLQFTFYYDQE